MSSYVDFGNQLQQQQQVQFSSGLGGTVLEEELQEKGAMFRDFLTSRVRKNNIFCSLCLIELFSYLFLG